MNLRPLALLLALVVAAAGNSSRGAEGGDRPWLELSSVVDHADWRPERTGWSSARRVEVDPDAPQRLLLHGAADDPADAVLAARGGNSSANLVSQQEFQDVELRLEFLVARGTNSGVKLNGLYEIQIRDSFGVAQPTADDCGGIYPRAELRPRYRFLDDGVPPRVNAAQPPGAWQTLEIAFSSPRFDSNGDKTHPARFVRVVLNGELIHENVDVLWPTGHAWNQAVETARGPLLLQGDHGPVAFRRIAVRPLVSGAAPPPRKADAAGD
ncbi:MAG TPA: DUF1080 domain-containing protein [Lacipirellulaceae bacterium]|nr:DUF1080 domain-containing protein [Lacipirellulaceae bacterium]